MPSKPGQQAKTMSAIAHGWRPTGSAANIPVSVAKEFHAADKGHKYGKGHDMAKHEKHQGHHATHGHAHTKHIGHAEHHEMHHEGHHKGGGHEHGHEHHAAHKGFEHHSPHHHENANSHKDGRKEHSGPHNPIEHGYGFGRHHDGKTDHGMHIAGGEGKHAHDANRQSIAGGYNPQGEGSGKHGGKAYEHVRGDGKYKARGEEGARTGVYGQKGAKDRASSGEKESHLRSHDNERGETGQPGGRRTGEDSHRQVEDRSMEHHIAGGEHGHHEHGSGRAEHHPSHAHMEPHRFRGHNTPGTHGFGHGVQHRQGHHRLSGHPHAHRIGHKG